MKIRIVGDDDDNDDENNEEDILKYVELATKAKATTTTTKTSPRRRSISMPSQRRSKSRMYIVEEKKKRSPRRPAYYIDPRDVDQEYVYPDDYEEDEYEEDDRYRTYNSAPMFSDYGPPAMDRDRVYQAPNHPTWRRRMMNSQIKQPPTMATINEAQRRHRNQVVMHDLMKNKNSRSRLNNMKLNHRSETEEVTYREPYAPNKPVIRGGAIVFR